ncbi:glucan ABC transporter ATP-binding protein/ permease [Orrella marina]|uniref:Glucan ABC transporter ATP-binding protein/ permease n=1 Tax=Orrella marina TaxID=2163011 RepID=A0A2R4XKK2_9BURK|nr:glucan ABC transporter ATP-binding protein/ permease [Orrella marina]AWB34326.1 glucan ABC transporter ATP-binding protein/ permease [Orrella marina]
MAQRRTSGFVQIYLRVLRLLGSQRQTAARLIGANLLVVVATLSEPILFGKVIDALSRAAGQVDQTSSGLPSALWQQLYPLLGAWVLVGLIAIMAGASVALFADRLAHRRRHEVLRDYFEHVLQLPVHHRDARHSGRLLKIMLQGTDSIGALLLGFFRDYFGAFSAAIVLVPVALYLNWRMGMLLLVLGAVFIALTRLILRRTESMQRSVEGHHSNLAEFAADTLGNVTLVQSFGRIQAEVSSLRQLSEQVISAQFPVLWWWAIVTVLVRAATTLTVLAMLIIGLFLFSRGLATVGEIVTFIGFSGVIISRLEQTVSFANRLSMEAPKLVEFFEVLDSQPGVAEAENARDPGRLSGAIKFDQVTFSYDGRRSALRAFNLSIEPGQTVALVGLSGAGKSTAMSLVYRLFDPQQGRVLIDGLDIRDMTLTGLRRNLGVVSQEALLFNRSIAENLMVGDPNADPEQLRVAASQAHALDFIERMPAQFDALAGERGRHLSGGERQRLAIARVLLKNPPILLLDEATSALDAVTEASVQEAIERARQGRTTLVIAHRLATVRRADRIVVLDDGEIVESGTFEELARAKGAFAQMVDRQFGRSSLAQ